MAAPDGEAEHDAGEGKEAKVNEDGPAPPRPEDDDGTPFDNMPCILGTCDECRDLRLLVGDDTCEGLLKSNELDRGLTIKWQRWTKPPDGEGDENNKDKFDFRTQETGVDPIIEDMKAYWAEVMLHHDMSKWFDRDKKYKRRHFPRGHVHVIQDFSMNGSFEVKREHHSRFFQHWQYTLYGMPFDSWIEDRTDLEDDEKKRLCDMCDEQGIPRIITDSVIVISEDTLHDVSAVIHYNEHVLVPLLKSIIKDLTCIEVTSDGAPDQYYNKDLVYWVSTTKTKLGVSYDWVIGVAAHGKDMSDGECGAAKGCVNTANMEHVSGEQDRHSSVENVEEVVAHLRAKFTIRSDNVIKKKGRGIYKRHICHVGLRKISRRRPVVAPLKFRNAQGTVKGIKSLHQFINVGVPGKIVGRARPCHFCPGCKKVDVGELPKCDHSDRCGQIFTIQMAAAAAGASLATLRNDASRNGLRMCRDAKQGDFIAFETPSECLPFFVGEIEEVDLSAHSGEPVGGYTGRVSAGDHVLTVRRWMPLIAGGGGNMYEKVLDGGEMATVSVLAKCARRHISAADADTGKEFVTVRRNRHLARADLYRCKAGTVLKYQFKDSAPTWYQGKVVKMNANGMAYTVFDDGDEFHNLPVSKADIAESGGNKLMILSGGVKIAPSQHDAAPHRRLSAKLKKAIAAAILPL